MTYTRKFILRVEAPSKVFLPDESTITNLLNSVRHLYWEIIELKDSKDED